MNDTRLVSRDLLKETFSRKMRNGMLGWLQQTFLIKIKKGSKSQQNGNGNTIKNKSGGKKNDFFYIKKRKWIHNKVTWKKPLYRFSYFSTLSRWQFF